MLGCCYRTPKTVRPRSAHWTLAPLCLVVFCLTAIVVYCWGEEIRGHGSAAAKHTATAYVVARAVKGGENENRIPFAATDDDPRRAEAAANAQADNYMKDQWAEWQRRATAAYRQAHQAAEQARVAQAQSEDRLEAFHRQTAGTAVKPQPSPRQANSSSPAMIDNPKWLDLNRRLGELQQRRDALLVDRTPAHPAVEDVAIRIGELKQQIAAVPRQIAGTVPAKPETLAVSPAKNAPATADSPARRGTEKLSDLQAAVERSRLVCRQAEAAEKRAVRDGQTAGPQYTVVYARIAENAAPADADWQRLMYTTLAAGLLMAFGAGFLAAGAKIHPPVASVAEVQAAAGVPVMATIAANSPLPDPLWLRRRQSRLRRCLLAAAILLMAACPAAAVWGLL